MSGGVDSSVALYLLKEQGFDPIGVSLLFSHWENSKNKLKENVCCSKENILRAKKVCEKYKAPHFIVDATREFQKSVIDYFIYELKRGRTPSPCLFCNRDVKIALLIAFARKKGIDLVGTGHYAKIEKNKNKYCLFKAKDKKKDQSYFLCLLKQNQLTRLILPLSKYTKEQVYKIAKKEKIDINPRQSQDLCFVSDNSMVPLLKEVIDVNKGKIIDKNGNILGEHEGLHFFTIGQRKGIGLSGGPYWVTGFDKAKNFLFVTNNPKDSALFSKEVILSNVNFISEKAPVKSIKVEAKCRFQQPLSKATLFPISKKLQVKIIFNKPQKAITPGQITGFYKKEKCLGGGVIQ